MNRTAVDGKVYVRRTRCATCIFRPGNLMQLEPGRRDDMVREADANESCIPCHSHLGNDIEPVCAGYAARRSSMSLRLAFAFDAVVLSDDPS